MKLLLIISSLFLLVSCTEYQYNVSYEKCNWQTGSMIFYSKPYYEIRSRDKNMVSDYTYSSIIGNVCSFSYTREEIK